MPELPNANPHYDRAKSRLHNGTTNEVARAQAEATLALAFEQQTANLIAYQRNVEQSYADRAPGKPRTKDAVELNRIILERLGLS